MAAFFQKAYEMNSCIRYGLLIAALTLESTVGW